MSSSLDLLAIQDQESVKNSYYRAPSQTPHIQKLDTDKIEVKTVDTSVIITKLEETILYIVSSFKFCPFWLIQQWFYTINRTDGFSEVSSWIEVGLVWVETHPLTVVVRPTRFLLDMFDETDKKFLEIPWSMFNHTCSEQQIVFDIHMGNPYSELWNIIKSEETLPVYHPLGLEFENESGTTCIRESDFRLGFKRYNSEQLLAREEEIRRQVMSGEKFTLEFSDFSRFPIVSVNKSTGELVTQTPDIIVPIPRNQGRAKSYAIEIELTPKNLDKYLLILANYKNNIKFGKLFYLCGSQRIAKLVKDAYVNINGLGTCELFLVPFTPPSQLLSNYSTKDEANTIDLIDKTAASTK